MRVVDKPSSQRARASARLLVFVMVHLKTRMIKGRKRGEWVGIRSKNGRERESARERVPVALVVEIIVHHGLRVVRKEVELGFDFGMEFVVREMEREREESVVASGSTAHATNAPPH